MDYDTLVVKESPGLCRCCLSEGCYKDLGTEYQWMNDTEVYADMLFECFDISITQHNEGPNGPNRLICEVCITRLRDACNFKKQVLESEKRFIDMIGRREFKPQMLIYQAQIKHEEKLEELPEEEVEYLEDDVTLQFDEDDQKNAIDLDEPLVSEDITVSSLPVKGKRGRPKKATKAKSEKVEKAKVPRMEEKKPAKMKESQGDLHDNSDMPRVLTAKELRKHQADLTILVRIILENSAAVPFKWWPGTFACFYCACPFQQISILKTHTKEHTTGELNSALKLEVSRGRIKFDISELVCRKCSKQFSTMDEFLTHATVSHDLKFDREATKHIFTFKLADNDLSCHQCGKSFKFFDTLLKHVYRYHSKSSPYLCEICGHRFATRSHVDGHIKSQHLGKQEKCPNCKKAFSDATTLTTHCKKCHGHKCPKCSEVFTTKYRRRTHLATAHDMKQYQFDCDQCSHQFTTKSKLLYHKSSVHFKEKNLSCSICGIQVYDKRTLKLHMVRHDDARPFQCDICKKTFQRKKTMELHRRIHTNDRRYVCKECGKAYVQYTSLKLHRKVHHANNEQAWM